MNGSESGTLDPQGPIAESIADLWWFMLVLGAIVFLAFLALLVWGLLTGPAESSDAEARHKRLIRDFVGIGGVAIPTLLIVAVFAATLVAMRAVPAAAPAGTLEIQVIGHQFWYEVQYPGSGLVTANELHLPVGQPVTLRLDSADVIHSFWVPALGGKLDMMPGRSNTLVLQADEPGEHHSRCAEFCGIQHARMGLIVVAEPLRQFEEWMSGQLAIDEADGAQAQRGREVFESANCVACHAFRGSPEVGSVGPDLTTLPTRRTLAGASIANTPENLVRWIMDPQSIKPGVNMPPADLADSDMADLLAYLRVER